MSLMCWRRTGTWAEISRLCFLWQLRCFKQNHICKTVVQMSPGRTLMVPFKILKTPSMLFLFCCVCTEVQGQVFKSVLTAESEEGSAQAQEKQHSSKTCIQNSCCMSSWSPEMHIFVWDSTVSMWNQSTCLQQLQHPQSLSFQINHQPLCQC